jgi:hypothetical protein
MCCNLIGFGNGTRINQAENKLDLFLRWRSLVNKIGMICEAHHKIENKLDDWFTNTLFADDEHLYKRQQLVVVKALEAGRILSFVGHIAALAAMWLRCIKNVR